MANPLWSFFKVDLIDVGKKICQIAVGENVCGTSLWKIGTKNQGSILKNISDNCFKCKLYFTTLFISVFQLSWTNKIFFLFCIHVGKWHILTCLFIST